MKRSASIVLMLGFTACGLRAQDLDKLQIHGYAVQSFLYSQKNNYLITGANSATLAWSEAAISVTDRPSDKLRVGMQMHFDRLGDTGGDTVMVDWAEGDYKIDNYAGVRAGRFKAPLGLFNDSQDIDTVFLWSLLPQSTYDIQNRSFYLSPTGVEFYGSAATGWKDSKLTYSAFTGKDWLPADGAYLNQIEKSSPLIFNQSVPGTVYGGDFHWQTPLRPLEVGSSLVYEHVKGNAVDGALDIHSLVPVYYAQFERGRWYAAGEYRRSPIHYTFTVGPYGMSGLEDIRAWYGMLSYHVSPKFQAGTYYSHYLYSNLPIHLAGNNSKDAVLSGRYDFNSNFYAKAEMHLLHGEALGYSVSDNSQGLVPRSAILIAKLGFSF